MEKSEALKQIAVLSKEINHKSRYLTTAEFIEKAKEKHGDEYDYSLVEYYDANSKVNIICKTHGVFKQKPALYLYGSGCQKCANEKINDNKKNRLNTERFIKKAREVHGNEFDYSLVDYKDSKTKVKIICRVHGVFEQLQYSHLSMGYGCKKCFLEKTARNR